MKLRAVMLLAALALSACAANERGSHAMQSPQPSVTALIGSRGVEMPLRAAVQKLDFAPFIPSAQIAGVAVIPPLSDDDGKNKPGIAIEYERDGDALLLSQWPREGFAITVGAFDATRRPCAPVAYKPGGLIWTTRNGRVMTLQPDGPVKTSRIARETARLLRAGACGQRRTRTLSRPLPARRSPSVSSPRQSAS